jgi:hypothetical protein
MHRSSTYLQELVRTLQDAESSPEKVRAVHLHADTPQAHNNTAHMHSTYMIYKAQNHVVIDDDLAWDEPTPDAGNLHTRAVSHSPVALGQCLVHHYKRCKRLRSVQHGASGLRAASP